MKQNRESGYGRDTVQIIRILEQNRSRFERVPIGPIGLRLSLKDDKWGLAIETCIKSVIQNFIVDNRRDLEVFRELLRSNGIQKEPDTITYHFTHEYKPDKRSLPSENFITIKDIVQSDSPVVINILMDMCKIEKKSNNGKRR